MIPRFRLKSLRARVSRESICGSHVIVRSPTQPRPVRSRTKLVLVGLAYLGVVGAALAATQVGKVSLNQKSKPASCVLVNSVKLEGVSLLSLATLKPTYAQLEHHCLEGTVLNDVLKAITAAYIDKGFVTTRAYVSAQDVGKTHVLKITVVEGKLSEFYDSGKAAPDKTEIKMAFPNLQGKYLNVRDIEQGLDQLNSVAITNSKSDFVAGKTPGETIVNMTGLPHPQMHLTLANNNHGSMQTGLSQSSAILEAGDLLHLDETISVTYQHTGPDYPFSGNYGNGYSNSISGNFNIPFGYWTGNLHASHYFYESNVAGAFGPINTTGSSDDYGGSVSRVISRDQNSKTSFSAALDTKASTNFLLGNVIETGTRQYTVAALTLSRSMKGLGGLWSFDGTYSNGLGILGATPPGAPGVGNADPLFSKVSSNISYLRSIELGKAKLEYSGTISGQWSPSNLLGSEQFSIGGYSTVRGVRDGVGFGNDGAFIRNQIDLDGFTIQGPRAQKMFGEIRPYVGLDYGHIFGQPDLGIVDADAAGWTVGIHNRGGNFAFDAGYSSLFYNTSASNASNGVFFASGSYFF